jgi:acyl-CoA reductase-like NAD-dependent aldehyde dehydrogenase
LQVYGYSSVDEAVALANDSEFGLNASVIGPDSAAIGVASKLATVQRKHQRGRSRKICLEPGFADGKA